MFSDRRVAFWTTFRLMLLSSGVSIMFPLYTRYMACKWRQIYQNDRRQIGFCFNSLLHGLFISWKEFEEQNWRRTTSTLYVIPVENCQHRQREQHVLLTWLSRQRGKEQGTHNSSDTHGLHHESFARHKLVTREMTSKKFPVDNNILRWQGMQR